MLPLAARLKKNRDFRAVYRKRRTFSTASFVLHLRRVDEQSREVPVRFGFVISKKVARKAHDRNRLKRRLREICRTQVLPALNSGWAADILIVARNGAAEADFKTLLVEVNQLCRTVGLL